MNVFRSVLLAVAVAAAMATPAPAHAAAGYDNCTGTIASLPAIITTQGTFCMKADLATTVTSGNAITVQANNVTIDCNDFKLGGLGAGMGTFAIGIQAANRTNITVRRCNVRGFYNGIDLTGSGALVEDNRLEGNTVNAIAVTGDGGTVRRNQIIDTGDSTTTPGAAGIRAAGDLDVLDNTINGVSFVPMSGNGEALGIDVTYNNGGSVRGNRIRDVVNSGGTNAFGIRIIYDTESVAVVDNVVRGSGGVSTGIHCGSNLGGLLRDNVVLDFDTATEGCTIIGNNFVTPL